MNNALDVNSLLDTFREEIQELGGRISENVRNGGRLYLRSILPRDASIIGSDRVQQGIALRYSQGAIEIRPYVFRTVCSNGAVASHSTLGRRIELSEFADPRSILLDVRQAIHGSSSVEAFGEVVKEMRESQKQIADMIGSFHELNRQGLGPPKSIWTLFHRIYTMSRMSQYELGNEITALARDTDDPELKWRRETAGAAIFARLIARPAIPSPVAPR